MCKCKEECLCFEQEFDKIKNKEKEVLKVVKISREGFIPTRATSQSAGCDIQTPINFVIPPWERVLVDSLIKMEFPSGTYGRIAPRSGLALKNGIEIFAGVVDADYRGTIKILLYNSTYEPVYFFRGDKIAQIICEKCFIPNIVEVDTLNCTERGENGFGSSSLI